MPCRVVYEKAMAFYFAVRTVLPSGIAMQQTYVRVAATVVQLWIPSNRRRARDVIGKYSDPRSGIPDCHTRKGNQHWTVCPDCFSVAEEWRKPETGWDRD